MVSEEGYEEDWQEEEWNENYEGYWADDQNWNDGYCACDDLYYMDEYGYFQRKEKEKEKERKARKARMMMEKEESQEMEKASQTMFNLRPHQLLPYRINKPNKLIILLLHQVLVMVSLLLQELNHYVLMLQRQSQHVLMF